MNVVHKKDIFHIQKVLNNFIRAPYINDEKYQAMEKGGAGVPSVIFTIRANKLTTYKNYIHSSYVYREYIRNTLGTIGFNMVDMINVGPKLQALFLNALETIGLKRLSLIAKTAFSIIQ